MSVTRFFIFLLISFISLSGFAQNIPNPGFESWIQYGGYKDPEGWFTINGLTILGGGATALQANAPIDVHSGSFALRLRSISIFGQVAPGIAATGSINPLTQAIDGGTPYNARPLGLSGWFKYAPSGTDTASVGITLTRWNAQTQSRETIAEGGFIETTLVAEYDRFWAPLTYFSAEPPDTMVIVLLSSSGSLPQANSTFIVDDLNFEFDYPTATENLQANDAFDALPYPVPASGYCFINNHTQKYALTEWFDIAGKLVLQQPLAAGINYIDASMLPAGVYTWKLYVANNRQPAKWGKITISH